MQPGAGLLQDMSQQQLTIQPGGFRLWMQSLVGIGQEFADGRRHETGFE
jgi:hypothetical protein